MKSLSDGVQKESIGVVIVNWNGIQDTLECLNSLQAQDVRLDHVVVVDNGSTDGSVAEMTRWALDEGDLAYAEREDEFAAHEAETGRRSESRGVVTTFSAGHREVRAGIRELLVAECSTNLGFAKGTNVGLGILMRRGVAKTWLLNNDTIVAPDAVRRLTESLDASPNAVCVTPQIRYEAAREIVWNCGGEWRWYGFPAYRYARCRVDEVTEETAFAVSFVTGCAPMVKSSWWREEGLLTERFFHGEEDVDLCWRWRDRGRQMLCEPRAVVFHKVSASFDRFSGQGFIGKAYGYYLNRLVFLRGVWGCGIRWQLWRAAMLSRLAFLCWRRGDASLVGAIRIAGRLSREGRMRESVDAEAMIGWKDLGALSPIARRGR